MAEVVVGRFRPSPGQSFESMELPGKGTYEAEFLLPAGLADAFPGSESPVIPARVTTRQFEFSLNGHRIRHVRTSVDFGRKIVRHGAFDQVPLIVRFQILEVNPETTPGVAQANAGAILAGILRVLVGALAAVIVTQIARALVEIRKIAETPAGAFAVGGVGLLAAGVGVVLLLRGS